MATDSRTVQTTVVTRSTNDTMYAGTQIVWTVAAVIEFFLVLRLALIVLGVGSTSVFASIIYNTSALLMRPFTSLFGTLPIGTTGLEGTAFIAMLTYFAIGAGISALLAEQSIATQLDPAARIRTID